MTASGFDSKRFAEQAQEQWNRVADGWNRWVLDVFAQWSAPVTKQMFDMAGMGEGDRVLDLAAGNGDQSLMAAQRIGPQGTILATDLSEKLLAYAEHAAQEAGLTNLETRVMNAEDLNGLEDGSFDIVICRLGLMLFGDRQQALHESYRVLRLGGRFAAMVFTSPQNTLWLAIPMQIALQHAHMPPPQPGAPGIFGLGAPGALEEALRSAGFQNLQTQVYAAPIRYESAAACTRFVREGAGAVRAVLAKLSQQEQEAAWADIQQNLQQFETAGGFQAPTEVIIGVGTK